MNLQKHGRKSMDIINTTTNTDIDSSIATVSDGIIEETNKMWHYIPNTDIKEKNNTLPSSLYNLADSSNAIHTESQLEYSFSLTDLALQYKPYYADTGIVSKDISISNFQYLCIDANITENEYSSFEFSILDGATELPILPLSIKRVNNELLYYNLPTRFTIDTSQLVVIRKNNILFATSWETFDTNLLNSNDVYTISYTPINAYKCVSAHNTIRIKLIIHVYDTERGYPPSISNVVLQKYGGVLQWQY
jgi:hypothetical protein